MSETAREKTVLNFAVDVIQPDKTEQPDPEPELN